MPKLTPAGTRFVARMAERHGFGAEAVQQMLEAVIAGNGGMAQFSHPKFGGSGQWMRGGMTMLSDLHDNRLKGRVDALCHDLSDRVAAEPGLVRSGSFQSQSQGASASRLRSSGRGDGGGSAQRSSQGAGTSSSLYVQGPGPAEWWGASLGRPDSAGAQDGVRYAYFAQARRLAIQTPDGVTVYDTADHRIGGFSQQQSGDATLSFTSQHGSIDVAGLAVVSPEAGDEDADVDADRNLAAEAPAPAAVRSAAPSPAPSPAPSRAPSPAPTPAPAVAAGDDVFRTIERLAELKAKGILTDDEFSAKKTELLARL